MSAASTRVLVTGAFGQIGTELTPALRSRHGSDNVLATGRHVPEQPADANERVATLDVTEPAAVRKIIESQHINVIYHLAAILSARGEHDPDQTWRINMGGL
ncbi:MAG: NAD-dependent epimerase/dehydratase family protein, partial [Gammaproteobacteria bacterium]